MGFLTGASEGNNHKMSKHNLLVTSDLLDQVSITRLSKWANVFQASVLGEDGLIQLLPSIDGLMIFSWPSFLTSERLQKMTRLKFIQSILAGVNHIPFSNLDKRVVVSSNAGAYSDEVAEHAWGLLLSAAKRIVEQHTQITEGRGVLIRHGDAAEGIYILKGKTLGILGYGSIGASVARIAKAFGMRVYALSRRKQSAPGLTLVQGKRGLHQVIRESDVIVLALPLNKFTTRLVDRDKLSRMKKNMVLVNIGRGELIDEKALFQHLKSNPGLRYATDVWWFREGKESLATEYPFISLPNFIGTPHTSGPSGLATGRPIKLAVENTLRFLKNLTPRNVVKPSDYLAL